MSGASLAVALEARSSERASQSQKEDQHEQEQLGFAETAGKEYALHLGRSKTLMSAYLRKSHAQAQAATKRAKDERDKAQDAIVHVKAARHLAEIQSLVYQVGEVEAKAELARSGLQVFQVA
ncbi:MAG: hypothetical protein AB7G08_33470, partial [Hyphomicrobiaceae bacterium]